MSESFDQDNISDIPKLPRSLKAAVQAVKDEKADRDDVVVDMKSAEQARLELVADELRPLINEIDEDDDRFELALSRGDRIRLWIDMTSFVSMGHDKRTYRFLKDTRMGRVVIAESTDHEKIADAVSSYVAEKVVERERMIEGDWISLKDVEQSVVQGDLSSSSKPKTKSGAKGTGGMWWFLIGVVAAVVAVLIAAKMAVPDAF